VSGGRSRTALRLAPGSPRQRELWPTRVPARHISETSYQALPPPWLGKAERCNV
jgi:hypothetical protein